jgi:hypothetical protein
LTTALDDFEDGAGRHARACNAPASIYGPQDQPVRDTGGREPVIYGAFCPTGHWDGANSLAFADEVYDDPTRLTQLDMFCCEFGGFAAPETAAEKDGQQRSVALSFD